MTNKHTATIIHIILFILLSWIATDPTYALTQSSITISDSGTATNGTVTEVLLATVTCVASSIWSYTRQS